MDLVHNRFPNLEQLIYEIGFPSVNKGSMIFLEQYERESLLIMRNKEELLPL